MDESFARRSGDLEHGVHDVQPIALFVVVREQILAAAKYPLVRSRVRDESSG